ncbi:MAG: hypothetical protein K5681_04870 [Treponema sp.]|nr:hypothetical protein [Treponema sp.]
MKNKFILGYSVIASIFIIFSVSFFCFNLYREYSLGEARTNTNFIRMTSKIKSASYQADKNSPEYTTKLIQAIGNFDDISYIEIKRDGIAILTYPDTSRKEVKSSLTMNFSDKALIRDSTLEIEASLYLLRPISIHYYAKIAFLMILIVTMTTIILIIYIQIQESGAFTSSNSELKTEDNEDNLDTEDEADYRRAENLEEACEIKNKKTELEEIKAEEVKASEADKPVEERKAFTEEKPVEEKKQVEEESSVEEKPVIEDSPIEEEKPVEKDIPVKEEKPLTEKKPLYHEKSSIDKVELPSEDEKPVVIETTKEEIEPNGLFSPITGIGWESYLKTRLENEISRAVASEMDFTLFVIQIPGSKRDSEIIKNVCNYLAIQFQFKDLLFEYKEDCIVAMKINMNLDEALNFADKLYTDIMNIISVENKKCFMGISTRSIRIVAAERLFTEAEQALEHAKEDPDSAIIAFRADSEKYRQYLDENR